jgi:hypothetical protein
MALQLTRPAHITRESETHTAAALKRPDISKFCDAWTNASFAAALVQRQVRTPP